MKQNYKNNIKTVMTFLAVLFCSVLITQAQTIEFSFENAQNTNDGTDDFYEVDIMIATIDGLTDFKLQSGLLYFKFNEAAFGTWIENEGGIVEYTHPEAEGYIAGQGIDLIAAIGIYGTFITNDNLPNITTWSFQQIYSSSTFANNNVTATPTKLLHLKFKYLDIAQLAMVEFVTDADIDQASDQFFTACGDDAGGATTTANCAGFPGTQILDASYVNTGAALSVNDAQLDALAIQIYPNPVKHTFQISTKSVQVESVKVYSILGNKVLLILKKDLPTNNEIDFSNFKTGIYIVEINTNLGSVSKKFIKE